MPLSFLLFSLVFLMNCSNDSPKKRIKKQSLGDENSFFQRETSIEKLQSQFGLTSSQFAIIISILNQKLYLVKGNEIVRAYSISSSKYGIGNKAGSNRTPLGTHRIAKKTGKGKKPGTILNYGPDRGKITQIYTDSTDVEMDFITTRILRLEGLQKGINKGQGIDSYKRHIYIHGTQEEGLIGKAASHGCIRMKNEDIIELFDIVEFGTLVEIQK